MQFLGYPTLPLAITILSLFHPPTSPCLGAAGCCEHWPLQPLGAGFLQERGHSTEVWWESDAASLLALRGVKGTWLISMWWGMRSGDLPPSARDQGRQLKWASGAAMCSLPPVACGPSWEGVSAFTGCDTG